MNDLPYLWMLPDRAELCDVRSGQSLTADQLREAVQTRATNLALAGAGFGHLVAIAQTDPLLYLTDLFACWAIGACAIAVNPALPAAERENVHKALDLHLWLNGTEIATVPGPHRVAVPLGADDAALVMTTSGTSGQPKGVALTLRAIEARIALNLANMPAADLATTLCPLPVFFGHGLIGNILTPLASGARVLLWPTPRIDELSELAGIISRQKVCFLSSVPAFWQMMLRVGAPPPAGTVSRIHVGSAPLASSLWQDIARWAGTDNVWNMFGMTEAANWISGARLADPPCEGAIGAPWGGRFAVLVDDGALSLTGEGELLLRSPALMQGYLNDPVRTAEAGIDGWFRTGDVATLGHDGTAILRGRRKSEINRAGIKVLAEEVDMLLMRHPDVAEALACGIPDAIAGEIVGAAVVPRAGATLSVASLIDWCRTQARAEAVPGRLILCDSLPRSDRGKPDRVALRVKLTEGKH